MIRKITVLLVLLISCNIAANKNRRKKKSQNTNKKIKNNKK